MRVPIPVPLPGQPRALLPPPPQVLNGVPQGSEGHPWTPCVHQLLAVAPPQQAARMKTQPAGVCVLFLLSAAGCPAEIIASMESKYRCAKEDGA